MWAGLQVGVLLKTRYSCFQNSRAVSSTARYKQEIHYSRVIIHLQQIGSVMTCKIVYIYI